MEYRTLGTTRLVPSVIGLGTWVMGGWLWGGAEDSDSLAAIRRALDLGVTLIDTAPIYGHGRAETLVGRAVRESGRRDRLIIATKFGLDWNPEKTRVWRDSSPARIRTEVEASLRRLQTDYLDLYQVHWPDHAVPFERTMEALAELRDKGTIRFIGVSNFDVPELQRCLAVAPVHALQPPYNLFERGIEAALLPFCRERGIGTLVYSPLCRGLLTGKYSGRETFPAGDVRDLDPKFKAPRFEQYAACVEKLKRVAARHQKSVTQLAVRWCLDQPGVTVALCGARRPDHIEETAQAAGWTLPAADVKEIEAIVAETVPEPIGPDFMGPKRN